MSEDADAIAYLVDTGIDPDAAAELVGAGLPRDRLTALRLGSADRVPLEEVLARIGLDASAPALDALGLPAGPLSSDESRALELYAFARTLFGDEATARFGRVVNSAMSRVAESAVTLFGVEVEDPLVRQEASPLERARAVDAGLAALTVVPELFEVLFRRQVLLAVARLNAARTADGLHETLTMTVGFADLVGSTAWIRGQTPRETAAAVGVLEGLALAALGDGGRLIKMIGDEVMFASPTAAEACRIARELLAAVDAEPRLPGLRVGLASGLVIPADGDLHGPVVNLAARLAAQAEPGQILVDASVSEAVGGTTPLAARDLAGFGEVVPYVLGTPGADAEI